MANVIAQQTRCADRHYAWDRGGRRRSKMGGGGIKSETFAQSRATRSRAGSTFTAKIKAGEPPAFVDELLLVPAPLKGSKSWPRSNLSAATSSFEAAPHALWLIELAAACSRETINPASAWAQNRLPTTKLPTIQTTDDDRRRKMLRHAVGGEAGVGLLGILRQCIRRLYLRLTRVQNSRRHKTHTGHKIDSGSE